MYNKKCFLPCDGERKEEKKMNVKGSKHMTMDQRLEIEICLGAGCTCKHIAERIGMDDRTVSKEIYKRRNREANGRYGFNNKCDDTPCRRLTRFPFVCNGCNEWSHELLTTSPKLIIIVLVIYVPKLKQDSYKSRYE